MEVFLYEEEDRLVCRLHKRLSALNGVEFGNDIVIMTEENAASVMRRVFVDCRRPGYDISGNGITKFQRVNDSTVMINVSKICMIESCWLAEFNYQDSYDYEIRPMAVLIKNDEEYKVRDMLQSGNID